MVVATILGSLPMNFLGCALKHINASNVLRRRVTSRFSDIYSGVFPVVFTQCILSDVSMYVP